MERKILVVFQERVFKVVVGVKGIWMIVMQGLREVNHWCT